MGRIRADEAMISAAGYFQNRYVRFPGRTVKLSLAVIYYQYGITIRIGFEHGRAPRWEIAADWLVPSEHRRFRFHHGEQIQATGMSDIGLTVHLNHLPQLHLTATGEQPVARDVHRSGYSGAEGFGLD